MSRHKDEEREQPGKIVLVALSFLAWLFLAASFLSYTPWDLPTTFVYHDLQEIRNLAGLPGAWCAYLISFCFGVTGYILVLGLGLALICFMFSRRISEPYNKTLGSFLILISCAGFAAYVCNASLGPPIGPGGFVGALVKFLLDKFLVKLGAYVALGALGVAGLLLIIPERVIEALIWRSRLGSVVARATRPFLERIQKANPERRRKEIALAQNLNGFINQPNGAVPTPNLERSQATVLVAEPFLSSTASGLRTDRFSVVKNDFQEVPKDERLNTPLAPRPTSNEPVKKEDSSVTEFILNPEFPGVVQEDLSISDESETEVVSSGVPFVSLVSGDVEYEYPSIDLLEDPVLYDYGSIMEQIRLRGEKLEQVCRDFKVELRVVDIRTGPVLTLYEVELEKGLRVKSLVNLTKDLEIAMKARHVRIVSPIPGKNTVGVEIPNQDRQLVRLREVMESCSEDAQKMSLPLFLGKDVIGSPMVADLSKLPHLLIAGRTGTGKSVCLNSIIMSLLMTRGPRQVKFIMIDPKMVELSPYETIPHLMHPVITDMAKAQAILEWAVEKMEERYRQFSRIRVRNLTEFNQLSLEEMRKRLRPVDEDEWEVFPKSMPSIVIVVDEMADLIMTSGKDVEIPIVRLAQKSRAVGIHLVLATQKPTVDVVTGLIKSNLPARISFGVSSQTDSRVVLDSVGAEQLLGDGDMLFLLPGTSQLLRGQGAFVSGQEINDVVNSISVDTPTFEIEIPDVVDEEGDGANKKDDFEYDPLYVQAVDIVIEAGRASTSMLQRRMKIGFGRAGRIIDVMASEGIISSFNPAKPSSAREVLITMEEWRGKQRETATEIPTTSKPNPSSPVKTSLCYSGGAYPSRFSEEASEPEPALRANATEAVVHSEDSPAPREPDEASGAPGKGWSDEVWNQYLNINNDLE
ncbi:MAG: DNA translocase FtsK [Thermoguttaceae bacterium]